MENTENKLPQEEQEIDLLELVQKLWKRRRMFYKTLGVALIVGLVIAFSIPKEYSVTVTLAPESTRRTSSSLASMAAMMGFGDMAASSERDALNILLFPDILASNPFALELYSMPVKPAGSDTIMALNEYISQAKRPWWSSVMGLPGKMVGGIISLFSSEDGVAKADTLNPFKLTKTETGKIWAIKKTMEANVDNKTGFTTITVTMQDAEVAATVADSVVTKLQDYVTTYRTKKAAGDCKYWEKLYKEKQAEYYEAQQKYANYVDENKNLFTQRSKIEGERLQNEMNLAYQIYNQMATQLQMAQGKLQEAKPVFAVVQPATVPLRPSAPRKMVILIGCLFLAFVGTAGWILFGEDIWKKLKNNSITEE